MSQFYTYPQQIISSSSPTTGTNGAPAPTSSTQVAGVGPDGNLHPINTDNSGNQNVNVISSVLPTGASTSALQTTGNGSLTNIDTKTPALGQALAASSVPVVLPAAQITVLTPPTTVTVTQATGTNLHTVVDTLPALPAGSATIGSVKITDGTNTAVISSNGGILVSGAAAVGFAPTLNPISVAGIDGAGNKQHLKQVTGTNALVVDGSAVTQPVSGLVTANAGTGTFAVSAATLPLPTGASTETTLSALNTKVTTTANGIKVDGSAVTQPVSGTVAVSNFPATQPVSAASLPLPALAATSTKQSDGSQKTQVVDGSGNVVGSSAVLGLQRLNVTLAAGGAPGTTAPAYTDVIGGVDTATGFAQQLQVDSSKNLKIAITSGATAITSTTQGAKQRLDVTLAAGGTPGSAIPTIADMIAGSDGTNLRPLSTDTTGRLNVNSAITSRSKVALVRNDYGSTAVTTAAYVQIIVSTSAVATRLEIFDSSGQTLVLAVGAAASEVDQFYINPGGNGQVDLLIPAGSRVSIKAVTANATSGYININLYS